MASSKLSTLLCLHIVWTRGRASTLTVLLGHNGFGPIAMSLMQEILSPPVIRRTTTKLFNKEEALQSPSNALALNLDVTHRIGS